MAAAAAVPLCSEAVLKTMLKAVLQHQFPVLARDFEDPVSHYLFLMALSEQVGAFDICPLKEVWVATWMLGPVIMRRESISRCSVSWLMRIRFQH